MQNIALNIVLNGVPTAIANLTQFEQVLNAARTQLTQLDIGSVAFKKLSAEIKTADNRLREFKKGTEGKDLEGRLGDFGKLGGAIGSSFAAATAAVQLFGDGSEESLKAVTTAQNALTIALAARGVAEGLVVVKTVATDIATKALAASTTATNTATKAFYTTLAANPYTAILAGVGLLIAGFVSLTSKTDEATKATKQFNDELNKDVAKEVSELNSLKRTLENTNLGLETRRVALEKLKTQFPKYFENLKDEDILTGKVKVGYQELAEAIRKAAQARFFEKEIASRAEETAKLTREQTKLEKQLTEELKRQKQERATPAFGGTSVPGLGAAGVQEQTTTSKIAALTDQIAKNKARLVFLNNADLQDSKEIQKINEQNEPITGAIADNAEKTKEAKKEEVITNTELIRQEKQLLSLTDQLNALVFDAKAEPAILKTQEEIIKSLDELAGKLGKDGPQIVKALKDIFNPPQPEPTSDPFKQIIDSTPIILKTLKRVPVLFEDIEKAAKEANIEIKGTFSEEQKQDITNFFNTLKKAPELLFEIVNKLPDTAKKSKEQIQKFFTEVISDYDNLKKRSAAGEEGATDLLRNFDDRIRGQIAVLFGINTELVEGVKFSNEELTKLFTEEGDSEEQAKKVADTILQIVKSLTEFAKGTDVVAQKVVDNNAKINKSFDELKARLAKLSNEEVGKFIQELGFNFQKGLTFIITNAEEFGPELTKQLLGGLSTLDPELEKLSIKQLKSLQSTLKVAALELEQYGINIEGVFDKVSDNIEKSIKEKIVEGILSAIEQFQMVLNSLSQTSSLYFQAQFEQLEKRYKRTQDSIVGDTEAANKKRLEAEKIYQEERTKLEKKQAKIALSISLAQAIANTAEAITKAYAAFSGLPPLAFAAAAAVAALNAVQVGIIGNQLASIDDYRRGGIIKKQGGGYITGPSHEMGGVKFQGGGIELEGRESVINRVSTVNYMGLLDQINQAGGGSPIYPNFDDSRIVEAIAKQRSTPIRAFVVESDITQRQNTARRLEQLAQI